MSFLQAHTTALGMCTAAWMELPVRLLPVAALTPTQQVAEDLWPERRPMPAACADPYPHVVKVGSVLYLEDGHHRWARARRDGERMIPARLLIMADAMRFVPSQGTNRITPQGR